ncbi:hypothetical protein BKA70DRAFT_1296853 [Coprinopsis sp. MPI-PUGE-AT-0042]|nr:hypothetical protein BKA70DRAFT_1296853 [Coprinopsis sp. MPI-PUGE-AT-0042]
MRSERERGERRHASFLLLRHHCHGFRWSLTLSSALSKNRRDYSEEACNLGWAGRLFILTFGSDCPSLRCSLELVLGSSRGGLMKAWVPLGLGLRGFQAAPRKIRSDSRDSAWSCLNTAPPAGALSHALRAVSLGHFRCSVTIRMSGKLALCSEDVVVVYVVVCGVGRMPDFRYPTRKARLALETPRESDVGPSLTLVLTYAQHLQLAHSFLVSSLQLGHDLCPEWRFRHQSISIPAVPSGIMNLNHTKACAL